MLKKTLFAASMLVAASGVHAVESLHQGPYLGAAVGNTSFPSGIDNDMSLSATGGYRFNDNFAAEVSYLYLGEPEDDVEPIWKYEATGFTFALKGIIPVTPRFEVFGKVGMMMWDVEVAEKGGSKLGSEDGNDAMFGLGAHYALTSEFAVVFEYQRLDVADGDLNNFSVGGQVRF